jgi:hypothetical protein
MKQIGIMVTYSNIPPVLFTIGPLQIRWYGLMYVIAFLAAYFLIKYQEKIRPIGLSPPGSGSHLFPCCRPCGRGATGIHPLLPVHECDGFCL